jgi:hypothetical protein
MAIKLLKKGYAFSFLSLFLVILIYFYAGLQFQKDTFSSENNVEESRILSMNEEILYFKESYLTDIFEVSSYVAFDLLVKESNVSSVYSLYSQDYDVLNLLLTELVVNGSLNGVGISEMTPYTLTNLTQSYVENGRDNYFLNTTFKVNKLVVYEEDPLSITVLADVEFQFVSLDLVSSWSFNKTLQTSFSIVNLYDPSFYVIADLGVNSAKINPVEQYSANVNWDLNLFNITLQNQLSTIYYDQNFKYTIGNSFLKNLFNSTEGSYKNIFTFYSFDYDEFEDRIYDTSQENLDSRYYGSSLILIDFQNISNLEDSTFYNHSILLPNGAQNSSNCAWFSCILFNSSFSEYVEIQNDGHLNNLTSFSSSFWFKMNNQSQQQSLISVGMNSTLVDGFELLLNSNLESLTFSFMCDSTLFTYTSSSSTIFSNWNFIYFDISLENQTSSLYLNGLNIENFDFSSSCLDFNISQNIYLGTNSDATTGFSNGSLDEFTFYSKILDEDEIGALYLSSKIKDIDYVDSFHGKGLSFENDILNISLSSPWDDFIIDDFSIGVWFFPDASNGTLFTYDTELSVGYNESGILISDNNVTPNSFLFPDAQVIQNRYNYLTITKEGANWEVYINGQKSTLLPIAVSGGGAPLSPAFDNGEFTFGSSTIPSLGVILQDFIGILDELVFYNKTLTDFDVQKHYFNFGSEVKGCCNYIIPFNPHIYGYNTTVYEINTSYSSNRFFNVALRGEINNITLYTIDNITSTTTDELYFNFLADNCILGAYNIYGFANDSVASNTFREGDDALLDCSWLIRNGYY